MHGVADRALIADAAGVATLESHTTRPASGPLVVSRDHLRSEAGYSRKWQLVQSAQMSMHQCSYCSGQTPWSEKKTSFVG